MTASTRSATDSRTQRSFAFRTWGGRRKGAGRKPVGKEANGPPHRPRARFGRVSPCHVTLRCVKGLPNLRERGMFLPVRAALRVASDRLGSRIVHFSVQRNHLHLIVEAGDWAALSRAVQGLEGRLAKLVNRLAGRRGPVFLHRYDAKLLKAPAQARAALLYVLANAKKHARQAGVRVPRTWIDPRSSGSWFDGWANGPPPLHEGWMKPRTWLLTKGWRRRGLIRVEEAPADPRAASLRRE